MQSWSREREVEKAKPTPTDLLSCLDEMDRWLSNDESIQELSLDTIIVWRELLAKHLGVSEQSWFERTGTLLNTMDTNNSATTSMDVKTLLRQFVGWLSADIDELHFIPVPCLSDSLDRFLTATEPITIISTPDDVALQPATKLSRSEFEIGTQEGE